MERKNCKTFFAFKIFAFESSMINSDTLEYDNCHWQSICYETSLRFIIYLRKVFSKWSYFRVKKRYDEKSSHAPFPRFCDTLTCLLSKGVPRWCFLESGLNKSFTV